MFIAILLHICGMQELNLPTYSFKTKTTDGAELIFDGIRNKFVVLTEEEWVRQHVLRYLTEDLGYPKGLIKCETGVAYNTRMKRSDIVVFNNKGIPEILVECKSPGVNINQATLEQAAMYNRTLKARIIFLTNGMIHYTFSFDESGNLVNLDKIPSYHEN